jgi:hypothetical protein
MVDQTFSFLRPLVNDLCPNDSDNSNLLSINIGGNLFSSHNWIDAPKYSKCGKSNYSTPHLFMHGQRLFQTLLIVLFVAFPNCSIGNCTHGDTIHCNGSLDIGNCNTLSGSSEVEIYFRCQGNNPPIKASHTLGKTGHFAESFCPSIQPRGTTSRKASQQANPSMSSSSQSSMSFQVSSSDAHNTSTSIQPSSASSNTSTLGPIRNRRQLPGEDTPTNSNSRNPSPYPASVSNSRYRLLTQEM